MAYLTLAEFKLLARLPTAYIDAVEIASPGFTEAQIALESAYVDGRLSKRYMAPFATDVDPAPLAVQRWLVDLVSLQVWLKRGLDSTQMDAQQYLDAAKNARDEIKEAANAKDGLWDLPLRTENDTNVSGIVRGAPLNYSEASPYVGSDRQRDVGRQEDRNRRGTYRP